MEMIQSRRLSGVTALLAFGSIFAAMRAGRPSWLSAPSVHVSQAAAHAVAASSSAAAAPLKGTIVGYLDMRDGKPALFAKEDTKVEISGWMACSSSTSRLNEVVILIDGEARGETKEFFSRPDVAAAFDRPDFEMSGWRTTVSIAGLKPGQHTLSARGIGSHGETGTVPAFDLNILE